MVMKKYIPWVIGVVVFLLLLLAYRVGYRFGTFGVGKLGTIEITLPLIQTDVFVDASAKLTTSKDAQTLDIPATPTNHQVIVSHLGYFPWTKKFSVSSGGKVVLAPIFVTQNATGVIITSRDSQYYILSKQISDSPLPTKDSPLVSSDKQKEIWVDANVIFIKDIGNTNNANPDTHQIIAPEPVVKNLSFYKDRSDAVLFAAGDSVYVVETDTDAAHVQNIFPIFKGTDPHFIETDPNFIYVLDGTGLMQVII